MASNKIEQDLLSLARELGSEWNKSNSKRYKEMAKIAGVPYQDKYEEEPDSMDDYNIAGHIAGNMPDDIEGDE